MDSVNEQEPYASAHAYGNRRSSTARSTPSSSEHDPSHDRLSHHRHRSSRTPPRRYPPRFRQSTPPYAARYISDEAGVLDDGYAHPAEQEVSASDSAHLPPHHRRRHHRSTRHHRHRDLSSNGSHRSSLLSHRGDVDDDGYFLSAVSGQPSLEVDDLHPEGDAGTPAATDGEATVGEEYALPTWPPGSSRLVEHRSPTAMIEEEEEGEVAEAVVGFFGRPTEALRSSTTMMPLPAAAAAAVAGTAAAAPAVVPTAPLPPFATAASSLTSPPAPGPRMKESDMPADPRNRLLDLVITNTTASVTLGEIEQMMQWSTRYEPMYGPLLEYLHSYQSIFVVSPVDDRVRLRRIFSIRTAEEVARRIKAGSPAAAIGAGGSGGVGLSASGAGGGGVGQSRRTTLRGGRRSRHDATPGPAAAAGGTSASHGAATGSRRAGRRTPSIGADRRSGKPSLPSAEALAAHIGSVSYSCVGEHLKLHTLETVYRRRGYDTAMMHGVLHVTNENDFHLFVFSSGAVVWWGMDRRDHWMVEDDFLSEATHITDGVEHRYGQAEIDALFPIWCSYEVDEQCEELQVASPLGIRSAAVTSSLERLATVLCFDHYLIPRDEPACSLVMLTFSHSLGRSARVDYFEHVTKGSHRHILSIPAELTGLLDYFSTKRRIAKLEGEIAVAQLAIQTIHDTPEVLWEVPWLQPYYDMVEQQNTAQSRLAWFASRSDTLLEQLSHIKGRRFRLFMLGSDVFLIVLLILDVMFMTSRLVAKMYFKVEEEE